MLVLRIRARNVDDVMARGYDTIRVYTDTSSTGTFVLQAGDIPLLAGQEWYEFVDSNGDTNSWYVMSYLRSSPPPPNVTETIKSTPIKGTPVGGPLGLLTVDYVWASTDIPQIQDLPASKLGELIIRTETELLNFTKRFGGLNISVAGWTTIAPIAARTLLEEIYLRTNPQTRSSRASGIASERIGNYSYTTRGATSDDDKGYFTPEFLNLITPYLVGRIRDTHLTTTTVFPELTPFVSPLTPQQDGVDTKVWNDYLDSDWSPVYASLPPLLPLIPRTVPNIWDI